MNTKNEPIMVKNGSMWHLVKLHAQPVTEGQGMSYVDHVAKIYTETYRLHGRDEDNPDDHCGKATFLLSHAMKYQVTDVTGALVDWCKRRNLPEKRTYVWLCELCVDQHLRSPTLDEVQRIVQTIPTVLPLMIPWLEPAYAHRLWCLYEFSMAVRHDNTIDLLFSPNDRSVVVNILKCQRAAIGTLDYVRHKISTRNAAAASENAQQELYKFMDEQIGFPQLDRNIRGSFQNLLLKLCLDEEC